MRIISLAPSNTEILFALGVEDKIVAVSQFCDWPAAAQGKPKISLNDAQTDKLIELAPDIILTSYFASDAVRTWSGPGKIIHIEPKTLWEVLESMRTIGEAVGELGQAEKLVADMKDKFRRLKGSRPGGSRRLYMEEWMHPPMAAGNWVPELVAIAGAEAVVSEAGRPSREFSLAALKVADPDAIICHWYGWGERIDLRRVLVRPGWSELRAVRERQVFFINDSLINRPGPRLVEGARRLQTLLNAVTSSGAAEL